MRLLAWTAAFQFFRGSPEFRSRAGGAFLKSLWQQVDFLNSHLQTTITDVPNDHIIAELVGLTLMGAAFPEFRAAPAWNEKGLRLLREQATAQTHPDGVNKEQATGYHRFVAQLLLLTVARARQGALPPVPELERIVEGMLEYVLFIMTPAGTAPMWGDADYSTVLGLGEHRDFWDFRPVLAAGAALYGRPDLKFAAGRFDEEAFWLLGTSGLQQWEQLGTRQPDIASRAFPHAGMYVIRDTWSPGTDLALFRCGPFGLGGPGHCAHAHCDLLSLILWMGGLPVLDDSGTYLYHGPWRDPFRLTAAHNAVVIDGRDQAVPVPNFNWREVPEAQCLEWGGDRVTGVLTSPTQVEFSRALVHPRPGVWEVVDRFAGSGAHTMEWFFHFVPGLELDLHQDGRGITVLRDGVAFLLVQLPEGGVQAERRESWYSREYGVKERNRELHARWQGELYPDGRAFHWSFQLADESLSAAGAASVHAR